MSQPPIFAAVEHDLQRGWHTLTQHLHHAHYHQPVTTATPATEAPMSPIQTIEDDAEQALAHLATFVHDKLPAAVADAKKIEPLLSGDLVTAFGSITHVPVGAVEELLIPAIGFLANAFAKPADSVQQPEPAPEPAA